MEEASYCFTVGIKPFCYSFDVMYIEIIDDQIHLASSILYQFFHTSLMMAALPFSLSLLYGCFKQGLPVEALGIDIYRSLLKLQRPARILVFPAKIF